MPTLPFQDLPVAARTVQWDAGAARGRIRTWATGATGKVDIGKYAKAFMFVDGPRENLTSYSFPFADVLSGTLTMIPRGVFAVAGGRGVDSSNLTTQDKASVKRLACRYYDTLAVKLKDKTIVCPFANELKASALTEAAKVLVSRLTEQVRATRQADGQGHCYFVVDTKTGRHLAGPFPDNPKGKAAAQARAQREQEKRAARG